MAAGMKKSMARSKSLAARGSVALAAAVAPALFLAAMLPASAGRWTSLHTWLAVAVTTLAVTSVLCHALASVTRPEALTPGDSPGVSHPVAVPSDTRLEVGK